MSRTRFLLPLAILLTLGCSLAAGGVEAPKLKAPERVPAVPPPERVFLRYLWREGENLSYRSFLSLRMIADQPEADKSMEGSLTALSSERHRALGRLEELTLVSSEMDPPVVTLNLDGRVFRRRGEADRLNLELSPEGEIAGWGRQWGLPWEGGETRGLAVKKPSLLSAFAPCGLLPSKDVKVGDAWSGQVQFDTLLLAQPSQVLTSSRLLEIGRFQGRPSAKVRTTWSAEFDLPPEYLLPLEASALSLPSTLPQLKGQLRAEVTWYFDYVAGRLLQSEGSLLLTLRAETQAGEGEEEVPTVLFDFVAEGRLKTVLLP
jgi:hypothetical protein